MWFSWLEPALAAGVWSFLSKSDFTWYTEVTGIVPPICANEFPFPHSINPTQQSLCHCVWHGTVTVFIWNREMGHSLHKIRTSLLSLLLDDNYRPVPCHSVYWAFALHMWSVCFIYLCLEIPHLTLESREMKSYCHSLTRKSCEKSRML